MSNLTAKQTESISKAVEEALKERGLNKIKSGEFFGMKQAKDD